MQGPPGAQRQEELEGAGDAIQIAQWLKVLGERARGRTGQCPAGPAGLDPLSPSAVRELCPPQGFIPVLTPCTCACDLVWK